ncbi:MAG: ribokinase [Patescibacteria group bacterium]|nr:MAG: ribokinase [Patescibacteria group bacterium]
MAKDLDFIAIGDTTTDAFIRIKQASIHNDDPSRIEQICLANGSKIPYESLTIVPAVGNSPNAAVSAARLGLRSGLITDFGDDDFGRNCLKRLKEEGVVDDYIKIHKGKKSNYHFVLWHKAERTILIKHHEYEYAFPDAGSPKWFYFSSVGEDSLPYHHEIADYLKNHPNIKLAFQPGTFQIKLGYEKLKDLYEETEVFFCNKEEAQLILKTRGDSIPTLSREMSKLGPKISVITDGPAGAYVFDGTDVWFMRAYPDPAPPYERTGAGDSFASTFTVALALGKDVAEALMWGPVNSMSVVQKIGAQAGLLSREELEEYLANAPEDYIPKKVG